MSQKTIRVHLNTADGFQVDGDGNHANTQFNLDVSHINALPDEILSVALIKSIVPISTSQLKIDEDNPMLEVFTTEPSLIGSDPTKGMKMFITKDTISNFGMGAPALNYEYRIPISYIDSFYNMGQIINTMIASYVGSTSTTTLLGYNEEFIVEADNTAYTISFNNAYNVPKLNSPLYRAGNEVFFRYFGFNLDTTLPTTSLGANEENRDIKYRIGTYKSPMYVIANLGLDSVSSKPETNDNNIIGSIPISMIHNVSYTLSTAQFVTGDESEEEEAPEANASPMYIALDGANDHLEFSELSNGSERVLDWGHDWSIGITLHGLGQVNNDQKYMALFTRDGNAIWMRRGGTNWGVYVSGNEGDQNNLKQGINTWYAPDGNSKLLFTYSNAENKLRYYLGDHSTNTYALRGTLTPNANTLSNGIMTDTPLMVGKSNVLNSNEVNWDGGLDHLIISDHTLTGPQIDEYFADEDYMCDELTDDLTSVIDMAQHPHPDIYDNLSNATGEMINGTPSDYVSHITYRFAGAPTDIDAVCIDPQDPHRLIFFKDNNYYVYNLDTEVQISGATAISSWLSQTTSPLEYVARGSHQGTNANGEDVFHQLMTWRKDGWFTRYQASNNYYTDTASGFWNSDQAWVDNEAQALVAGMSQGNYVVFKDHSGTQKVITQSGGSWTAYGSGTGVFEDLPNDAPMQGCINDLVNNKVIAFLGNQMYTLNLTNNTVSQTDYFGS